MTALGPGLEVPAVHLNEVHLEVRVDDEGTKYVVMGPIALVLPLDPESVEWLQEKLKGGKVQVFKPGALSALPTTPPGS